MSWAVVLSGYPAPSVIPDVVAVPPAHIAEKICGGARCAVVAFLDRDADRVYVDERMDVESNTQAQGYLVHEFVHHLQRQAGKLHAGMSCAGRQALEREAYGVQLRFLSESGEAGGAPATALGLLDFACSESPAPVPGKPQPGDAASRTKSLPSQETPR